METQFSIAIKSRNKGIIEKHEHSKSLTMISEFL